MESIIVRKTSKKTTGIIHLEGSKSISNRALIIRALSKTDFPIEHLSISDDSNILQGLLSQSGEVYDTGHAGTCYRFMTAYLALQEGTQTLTGSARMKERPIGPLVDALRSIGAEIDYIENEGYPPLLIKAFHPDGNKNEVSISGEVSSQYLSALLMIAPVLPSGLTMNITGNLVSRPYLEMTLRIMKEFGVEHEWVDDMTIHVGAQAYQAKPYTIESDWSAASYHYIIAAFSEDAEIELHGLFDDSLQGDRAIADIATSFGVHSTFKDNVVTITKTKDNKAKELFEYNFIRQPDLAQSVAVMSAGLGVYSIMSGLSTLKIKETDRIHALQQELAKTQVFLSLLPKKFSPKADEEFYAINGQAAADSTPEIETYKDHRMAMAFAPLGVLFPVKILKAAVVSKSYISYWKDLEKLGFSLEESK